MRSSLDRFSEYTRPVRALALLGLVLAAGGSSWSSEVPADHARRMQEGLALFKEHVRPALIQHCLDCHGGQKTKGSLDLSDRKPLIDSGVIEGGRESLLYSLITHEEEPHMPQKAPRLPDATIERIARWIELGAPYDHPLIDKAGGPPSQPVGPLITDEDRRFWSFRPLADVSPPPLPNDGWGRTPIDAFIGAALDGRGLRPNPAAD